ncbi:MAG: HIT family protein [Oxalobacter sp.]|nr:HIT family protein [Oxalobacter sp.]
MKNCILCETDGAEVIYRTGTWRVLLVDDANLPGFCRVVLNDHTAEMTDLPIAERTALMEVVWIVEQAVRDAMQPDKINLASLGNMVPHLHWHIIPRYQDDASFPDSIWSVPHRTIPENSLAMRKQRIPSLRNLLKKRLYERYGKKTQL